MFKAKKCWFKKCGKVYKVNDLLSHKATIFHAEKLVFSDYRTNLRVFYAVSFIAQLHELGNLPDYPCQQKELGN